MNRKNKILVIGIGLTLSILLVFSPFLNWKGIGINVEKTNLINGITEMLNKLFPSFICFLIGILPTISALDFVNRESKNKILVLSISFLIFGIQIFGIWAIHIEFMMFNYGKTSWTLSFGYLIYLSTQVTIGIMNIFLFGDFVMNKNFIQKQLN